MKTQNIKTFLMIFTTRFTDQTKRKMKMQINLNKRFPLKKFEQIDKDMDKQIYNRDDIHQNKESPELDHDL